VLQNEVLQSAGFRAAEEEKPVKDPYTNLLRDLDLLKDYVELKCSDARTIFYGKIGLGIISYEMAWDKEKVYFLVNQLCKKYAQFTRIVGGLKVDVPPNPFVKQRG